MRQKLVLPSRGLVIADRVTVATSARERVRGLLGTAALEAGAALILETRQVHTFGMRYAIDVVFCSGDGIVLHLVRAMRPDRVSRIVFRARRVIELPAGGAGPIRLGDLLSLVAEE